MSWIKDIRKTLNLNRLTLAGYLRLAPRTVEAIELSRRQLPDRCALPALALLNATMAAEAAAPAEVPPEPDATRRRLQKLHQQCRRKLEASTDMLARMQREFADAGRRLKTYQLLADALPPATNKETRARHTWVQRRLEDQVLLLKASCKTEQDLLTIEIALLTIKLARLEELINNENS